MKARLPQGYGKQSMAQLMQQAQQMQENVKKKQEELEQTSYSVTAGGGMVELMVTLDTNGYVVSATVDKSVSTPDECMQNSAMNAARQSRFNVDPSAPKRQTGTISYTFIPQ